MNNERFNHQISFLLELDKLKDIKRQSRIIPSLRRENSAEHSWHIAIMALVLGRDYGKDVDLSRVVTMLLLHDIVEIDAGDTYAYDQEGYQDKEEREQEAAARIFGLLPPDQAETLRTTWEEFEQGASREARFAHSMDRLMPLLHNYYSQGSTWKSHGTCRSQVQNRMAKIREASPELWEFAENLIDRAVSQGYLAND
ncbi:HD domain-containing protein [Desulfoplanes sp. PS50]